MKKLFLFAYSPGCDCRGGLVAVGDAAATTPDFFPATARESLCTSRPRLPVELQQLAVRRGDQIEKAAFLFELEREAERAARSEAEETLRESQARLDKASMDYKPRERAA